MNSSITMNAYAKINLSLEVLRRRPDGYHDILSFMQDLGLHDVVTMGLTEESLGICMQKFPSNNCFIQGVRVKFCMNYSAISLGPDNLAYRGVEAVLKALPEDGKRPEELYLFVDKKLPVAAGIAGGSGNAAGCMLATNALCGNPFSLRELMVLGASVGADVPFSLMMNARKNRAVFSELPGIEEASVAAEIEGIGEIVRPTEPKPYGVILMNPGIGVSTREVYEALDAQTGRSVEEKLFFNRMEEYTLKQYPEAKALKDAMEANLWADRVLMSGSGPTMVAYYNSMAQAESDYRMAKDAPWIRDNWKVWYTESGEMYDGH